MTEGHTERLEAALAGRYRIERKLGEGGMASVYLAEDLKHERKVALKILRPELAAVLGTERFLSEIKTTANLQHPHILPLHDSGEADGYLYYVMPYIDGETLREKLEREKQLGVEEAVRIARDVADALDYAHRHGVIHRDIKPGNILLHDGRPVVADFGIALAVSAAGGGRMTETGLSLGTPHYMSPEQASADRDLSARSDVYSLGCVLYEMLGGQPPHTGPSAQSILVHILTKDVTPLTELRHTVPANVAAAVARAIEKLPADRFETAKEFRDALEDPGFAYAARPASTGLHGRQPGPDVPSTAMTTSSWIRDRRSLGALAVVVALAWLAALGRLGAGVDSEPRVPTRAELSGLSLSGTLGVTKLAISPDGSRFVAEAVEDGVDRLFIRSSDDVVWRPLPNTEGGTNPTFSPDGASIAFDVYGANEIRKVPVSGGSAFPLAQGDQPHWATDDTIVFVNDAGLYWVGSSGGEPELLLRSDTLGVWRPYLLPGGRAIVFATGNALTSRILLLEIGTGEVRELLPAGSQPRYVATGHLLYGQVDPDQNGALMGVPFDLAALEVTGAPVTLVPDLNVAPNGSSQFAVSENGTLLLSTGRASLGGPRTLAEVTLDGEETPLPLGLGAFDAPRYSPDGSQIAYMVRGNPVEVRIYTFATGRDERFEEGGYPVWSRTGEYIYYSYPMSGPGVQNGYRRKADQSEDAEQLWDEPGGQSVFDVSADDSVLVVRDDGQDFRRDIRLVRRGPDGPVWEDFLIESWREVSPQLSPDGRWLMYQSDEEGPGDWRVYVHSFPTKTGRRAVSPALGGDPIWAPDGRRIYYRSGSRVMAVDVTTEPDLRFSAPRELFDRPEYTEYRNPGPQRTWDIHPDGSRFVVVKDELDTIAPSFNVSVITGWFESLRQQMGDD